MATCHCGCDQDDHGHDDEYPNSTACINHEDCIAYEWDGVYVATKPTRAERTAKKRTTTPASKGEG